MKIPLLFYNAYANIKKFINKTKKDKKKMTKTTKVKESKDYISLLELFVIVSIGWMAYMVILGSDGNIRFVMSAPALLWGAVKLVKKFSTK